MREPNDGGKGQALAAALEMARRRGRFRECDDLGSLLDAVAPFLPAGRASAILRSWTDHPGARYVVAVVPPGPHLSPGDWHAGPVNIDGRDGVAVLLVVDNGTAGALERPAPPAGRSPDVCRSPGPGTSCGGRRRSRR